MHLYRSNRAEVLVERLARVLAEPPADPLEEDWIVVQGPGMERWLALELASRLGVFAHARFPFPRAFLERALAGVLGDAPDAGQAWEPEQLGWAIAERLPRWLDDPRFVPIRRYLHGDDGDDKLVALARRIAETFDHYAVYRPDMVLAWERGDDTGLADASPTNANAWQPVLWRDLVDEQGNAHWAARIERLCAALGEARPLAGTLPARACLFGLSTLPPLFVTALAALGSRMALHAFVLSPSREYWGDIRSQREMLRARRPAAGLDEASDLHFEEGHPLLASLARVGREFQAILEERVDYVEPEVEPAVDLAFEPALAPAREAGAAADADLYVDPAAPAARAGATPTLLHGLQSDILALRSRGGPDADAPPRPLAAEDDSLSVHACHGPMREAQVLRDQLLDAFARDPALAPHDVVVMAPDVERYAPFVEAAFAPDGEDGAGIPVRVADRGARVAFPVVDAWQRLVELLGGRLAAGDVLDLLGIDCVRARFGLTVDDEALLRAWIEASGIRWGIDDAHRAREGQPADDTNTWRFGLDRLFAGMAVEDAPGRLVAGVAPQAGVEGSEAEALGRLAELTATLFALHERARGRRPVAEWGKLLGELLDRMIAAAGDAAHERQIVLESIDALVRAAERAGHRTPIGLPVVRDALERSWTRRAARGGFLTGAVTVCEMLPMRSIPFRVVCLLGLDDGAFPRVERRPGFDLIGQRRRLGDRSARDDDRQLFLEALLSARDRVIVTYVGSDIRDNAPRPPAVVVDELLDHVARAFVPEPTDDGDPLAPYDGDARKWARRRLVVRHPLQPWSPAYFGGAGPGGEEHDPRLFSYAKAWARAARGLAGSGESLPEFVPGPLGPPARGEPAPDGVPLADLQAWLRHPARFLLREILDVRLADAEPVRPDREPLDLEGLEAYGVGEALLRGLLAGEDPAESYARLRAEGILPLGAAGLAAYEAVAGEVRGLAARVIAARHGGVLPSLDVDLACAGTRLTGRLDGLHPGGRIVPGFAKLGHRSELDAWMAHLVLCAVAPEGVPLETRLVGRPDGRGAREVVFGPVAGAADELAALVALYRVGRTCPLPFFPRASRRFADTLGADGDPGREAQALLNARNDFGESARVRPEGHDPYVRQLFGHTDPLAPAYRPVDTDDETLGFAGLARRVFLPLLRHRKAFT